MKVIKQRHISDPDRSRYNWDFSLDWSKGWCQLDTGADAWHYGNWVNLKTYEIIIYAEGDFEHVQADNEAEFVAELGRLKQVLEPPVRIDTMCVETNDKVLAQLGLNSNLEPIGGKD